MDDLEAAGHWDERCTNCAHTFADTDSHSNPHTYCDSCKDALFCCSTCGAEPGDGYTAECHDADGCGYAKANFGALSNRLPEER